MIQPKAARAQLSTGNSFLICLALLVAVLSVLFHANFDPDQVSFSNDAPVGAIQATCRAVPDVLTGVWVDLNWVGGPEPTPALNLSMLIRLITKAIGVGLNHVYAPASLLTVGLCGWFLFWRMKFAPLACILGGLAAALNSDFLNTAAWGVCSQPIAFGMNYLALGALADTTSPRRWVSVVLAGFAIGLGVMEAADIGALFSLFVAAFIVFQSLVTTESLSRRVLTGLSRLGLVAVSAGLISAAALSTLVGTQVQGVVGAERDTESKSARWSFATQYSLPKAEALGILVPGLFGLRADSPDGGAYWGRAGSDISWDEYVDSRGQRGQPSRAFRAGAGSNYAGVLVLLIAAFGVAQSFRRQGSLFDGSQRKLIWFWCAAVVVALLLMFGRFAPFYQLFYALPYVSTIRNPAKFLHIAEWSLLILFGYGADALCRSGMSGVMGAPQGLMTHWQSWWARVRGFDRRWVIGSVVALILFGLAWLFYASSRESLERHLIELTNLQYAPMGQRPDTTAVIEYARKTASFSIGQVARTFIFLVPAVGLVALTLSGYFRGSRAKLGGALFVTLLIADLLPIGQKWVVAVNWKQQNETNPVIEFLHQRTPEGRVTIFPLERFINLSRLPREAQPLAQQYSIFAQLYRIEWMQHLFPFYDIQSLDIVQEPRVPVDKAAFEAALVMTPVRRWELTNTRYLIGPAAVLELFNQQIDPVKKRLRVATEFDLVAKPGAGESPSLEQITATAQTNGQFAVFEFTGALPRAKLYANWQVATNDPAQLQSWVKDLQQRLSAEMASALAVQSPTDVATLKELGEKSFDPQETVLLAKPIAGSGTTNQNAGEVQFVSYAPKRILLAAKAQAPAILLLNDKYDPNWRVWVDGQPATLLRCNFIMRGVQIPPGEHQVEFRFTPSLTGLYVSLAALLLGVALLGYLVCVPERRASTGP